MTDAELRLACFCEMVVFCKNNLEVTPNVVIRATGDLYAFVTAGAKQPERGADGRFKKAEAEPDPSPIVDATPENHDNHAEDVMQPRSLLHRAFGSF